MHVPTKNSDGCRYVISCVQLFCDPMDYSPPVSFVNGTLLNTEVGIRHGASQVVKNPPFLSGKEFSCQCRRHRRQGSITGLGLSPREGNGNPPQYSYLEKK